MKRNIRSLLMLSIILGLLTIGLGCNGDETNPTGPEQPKVEPKLSSIQTNIFDRSCALSGCHRGVGPPAGLNLENGKSFANLVDVTAIQRQNLKRVGPATPGDSYLVRKVEGGPDIGFSRMPPGGRTPLSSDQIKAIRDWIKDGAKNN